jgi:hypothetical protein
MRVHIKTTYFSKSSLGQNSDAADGRGWGAPGIGHAAETVHDVWLTGRAVQYAWGKRFEGILSRLDKNTSAWPCSYEQQINLDPSIPSGSP